MIFYLTLSSCSRGHSTSCLSETDFFCELLFSLMVSVCSSPGLRLACDVIPAIPGITSGPNTTYISEQKSKALRVSQSKNVMQKIREILLILAQVPSTVERAKFKVMVVTYMPWKTQAGEDWFAFLVKEVKAHGPTFLKRKVSEIWEQSFKFAWNLWSTYSTGGSVM